ncbi:glycosyltransferase [Marinobacter salarius]|uniref:glycosyltransferase n=1 Tax=Marinobacter salarius TaxID=1420917 RepID=UPI0015A5164C|nr:glycosyltransferase [Marinobacter salarius]
MAEQDTKALIRFLRQERIGAVLAEYGPTAVSVMHACSKAGIPLITQFHGYDAYRESLTRELEDDYKELFSLSSAVVGVSKDMCSRLKALGAVESRLFHNACGADISDKPSFQSDFGGGRFLMVGRLVEKKAPFVSILAFSKLALEDPRVSLEIIGDGPQKGACLQLCKALGIEGRVIFSGAREHRYVLTAMASADCFIQHSVRAPDGDCEGTPVGVLEALGMGLPVVATRHGGITDIVEERHTGLLVDEYDAEGMFQAMKDITEHPDKARSMGENARASVLSNWTSEKSVDRLWEIIQSVSH